MKNPGYMPLLIFNLSITDYNVVDFILKTDFICVFLKQFTKKY